MLIDTHTHIDIISPDSNEQDNAVKRALDSGVGLMVNAGVDLRVMKAVQALSTRHSCMRYAVGMHPEILDEPGVHFNRDDDEKEIKQYLLDRSCIAVGEIGLDYYHNRENSSAQMDLFEWQLQIAVDSGKPVLVHARDAWDDTFQLMQKFKGRARGVFHCFSGGTVEARKSLDLGFFVSFAGNLTYPTAEKLREAALFAPAERTLLETDAPFLAPVPMRGKKNEPAFVTHTYKFYSELKKISVEEISGMHVLAMEELSPGIFSR